MSDVSTAPTPPPTAENRGWVVMYHPELDAPDGSHVYSEQPPEAFDDNYKAKGWKLARNADGDLVDDEGNPLVDEPVAEAAAPATVEPPTVPQPPSSPDLTQLSPTQLQEAARALGVDDSGSAKVLRERIAEAQAAAAQGGEA